MNQNYEQLLFIDELVFHYCFIIVEFVYAQVYYVNIQTSIHTSET